LLEERLENNEKIATGILFEFNTREREGKKYRRHCIYARCMKPSSGSKLLFGHNSWGPTFTPEIRVLVRPECHIIVYQVIIEWCRPESCEEKDIEHLSYDLENITIRGGQDWERKLSQEQMLRPIFDDDGKQVGKYLGSYQEINNMREPNGKGCVFYDNGEVTEGEWQNGSII
jgi:hypothetical protein